MNDVQYKYLKYNIEKSICTLFIDQEEYLNGESELFAKIFSTSNCKEGLTSFLNKNKPKFSGL